MTSEEGTVDLLIHRPPSIHLLEPTMYPTLRAERATDHPTREPTDHANQDRRRRGKHPRGAAPSRSPERPSWRH